jgi:hypothetical protein
MSPANSALTPALGTGPESSTDTSPEPSPEPSINEASWRDSLQLLRRAAQLAAASGAEPDLFMQAAWAACLDARPGLREQIENKELRAQLKKLRKRGRMASA